LKIFDVESQPEWHGRPELHRAIGQVYGRSDTGLLRALIPALLTMLTLASCGGGGASGAAVVTAPASTAALGGFVSGLTGSGLALSNNGGEPTVVSTNGGFVLATGLAQGDSYSVTITSQPADPVQSCMILDDSGTGTIATDNVAMIAVVCESPGRFLYVTAQQGSVTTDNLSAYSIDSTTGALTAVATYPYVVGSTPAGITVDPGSRFVFVAVSGYTDIAAYAIDRSSGALGSVAGSPFTVPRPGAPPDVLPLAVAVDPSGQFLYVAGDGGIGSLSTYTGSVSVFNINATSGALTALPSSPYASGFYPEGVVIDPSDRFVYVGYYNLTLSAAYISAFSRDAATGALTAVAGSPFLTAQPFAGDFYGAQLAVNPNGKFLYVGQVAIDPTGHFAYTSGTVTAYAIDSGSGALTPVSGGVVTGSTFSINAYSINSSTGALTLVPGSPYATGGGTDFLGSIAVDPSGAYCYAVGQLLGNIFVYAIDPASGALTALAGSPFPGSAAQDSIVVSK
jgi:6-phosphogluconolactonase